MSLEKELEELRSLREKGELTEEEYQKAREYLIKKYTGALPPPAPPGGGIDPKTYAMLIHLSLFAGWIIPLAGLVLPIVLWQIKKDESEFIDRNGRIVCNWILSSLIYGAVSFLLVFVLVGFFLWIVLFVLGVVFPIIGAVKANNGEAWPYPLSIPFFPTN